MFQVDFHFNLLVHWDLIALFRPAIHREHEICKARLGGYTLIFNQQRQHHWFAQNSKAWGIFHYQPTVPVLRLPGQQQM